MMLVVVAALALFLGVGVRPCFAGPIDAVYSLGAPSKAGDVVSFGVNLSLTSGSGYEAVFFGLDVSPSSAALTAGGTSFSAFSFEPASPLLDDWAQVKDFGGVVGAGTV